MIKNLNVFFNKIKKCSYGVGYFHRKRNFLPVLQEDKRYTVHPPKNTYKARQYTKRKTNRYC
ncbi:MAG: hypothetical protein IKQ35_02425 [Bacilli bacterium]|nr:hypothetical protein [Bacilli bacterium]